MTKFVVVVELEQTTCFTLQLVQNSKQLNKTTTKNKNLISREREREEQTLFGLHNKKKRQNQCFGRTLLFYFV